MPFFFLILPYTIFSGQWLQVFLQNGSQLGIQRKEGSKNLIFSFFFLFHFRAPTLSVAALQVCY